jgi:alpha-L-fucosidase
MEINMFCHFGPNTFTGAEWGSGQEDKTIFNPTALDCRQWADVARQAGMGGIILTAKHHDGFCLWPSAFSSHTVSSQKDVLREFVNACHEIGVKPGVYISPWDRNHPSYGTPEYNTVFASMLHEVHDNYGPFFEQWFDGACGEGPNGKRQEYDWTLFNGTVLNINPQTIIFSDWGPGCRWVGNEEGKADETCWSIVGDSCWVPVEADVSIRPGWFWHANERPKRVDELMEIYFNSVGRNGLLLLNVPPDNRGRIPAEDSAVLVAFRQERDRIFSNDLAQSGNARGNHRHGHKYHASNILDTAYHTYWAAASTGDTLHISTPAPVLFDVIMLQEYIPLGQRVSAFHVDCCQPWLNDGWVTVAEGTTIGYKRLMRIPPTTAGQIRIVFDSTLAAPIINRIALYNTQAQ